MSNQESSQEENLLGTPFPKGPWDPPCAGPHSPKGPWDPPVPPSQDHIPQDVTGPPLCHPRQDTAILQGVPGTPLCHPGQDHTPQGDPGAAPPQGMGMATSCLAQPSIPGSPSQDLPIPAPQLPQSPSPHHVTGTAASCPPPMGMRLCRKCSCPRYFRRVLQPSKSLGTLTALWGRGRARRERRERRDRL